MVNYTRKILLKHDEVGRYETPSKFNYNKLTHNVFELKTKLEEEFNLEFIIDDQVQDASFYCDIEIPHILISEPKKNVGYSIRISNFGHMATIFQEIEIKEPELNRIKRALADKDFQYISPLFLDQDYDGNFEEFKTIYPEDSTSWAIRYFDYL